VDGSNSVADLQRFTDWNLAPAKGNRVASRLTVVPSTSQTIAVSREASRTEAAAPTAYGTALPEAAITFTDSDETPKRVGVWLPVTKGAWTDRGAVEAMVRALLGDELLRELDDQILNGDATGENLRGIVGDASITTQALGGDTHGVALLKACASVRAANHAGPLTVIASASDLQDAALSADFRDHVETATRVFGLESFVATSQLAAGTMLVADLASAVHLYVRSPLSITVSDSHTGFFTEGKVAVLAEMRAELRVVRGDGVVKITGV
jgi:hypothetical protein